MGANMAAARRARGVFGETAAGVTLGALREAVRAASVGADDRVVLLVTGDGLKTPGPVEARFEPVEIDADAELCWSGSACSRDLGHGSRSPLASEASERRAGHTR